MENLLLIIPLLPLLGAAVNGTMGRKLGPGFVSAVGILAVGLAGALSVSVLLAVARWIPEKRLILELGTWFSAGGFSVEGTLLADPLSALMMTVVTLISTLIHVYSAGYMKGDAGYARYFAYLNLFVGSMLILVMAGNLVLMFVGWEGVGLCSYLLIGFWFQDETKASAGKKAFIVNRIGDLGFMIGILLIFSALGVVSFEGMKSAVLSPGISAGLLTSATLLLFIGACGKSAQIPLYVWLPDAMAGPTPVSALIHAATMVTAGVYMICRMSFMFSLAPVTMGIVSIVGAATALFAASIGLAQNDIKKVLAYSTVSQLGYMIAAAGVAAYSAAMFHLLTHAFFKACLFLCAGSVIHALGGEQDIRKMGGLYSKLPDTAFTFLVSTLAIAGIPPLSGFFSKDEIVWMAFISRNDAFPGLNFAVFGALAAAALMTSLYMFRLYYMVFGGKYRGEAHPHESPGVMLWPLFLLSSFTIVGGLFGMPEWLSHALRSVHGLFTTEPRLLDNGVETFLEPSLETPGSNMYFAWLGGGWEMALVIFSVLLAVTGWAVARRMYAAGDAGPGDSVAGRAGWLYRAISAKWYVDEIYEFAIVRPFWAVSGWLYAKVDGVLIEKAGIGGPVRALQLSGWVMRRWQNGNMQRYLAAMLIGAAALLYVMTR